MALTSAAHPAAGDLALGCGARCGTVGVRRWRGLPDLVLFDRDGTLVHDVPYNGDPAQVRPVDGARGGAGRAARARASGSASSATSPASPAG